MSAFYPLESFCPDTPHRILHIHVGTTMGVRLETLMVPMPDTTQHIVLQPSNGFAQLGVRVRSWGADKCRLVRLAAEEEEEEEFDVEEAIVRIEEEESDDDERLRTICGKRCRAASPLSFARKRACYGEEEEWVLDMTDELPERVAYVWLLPSTEYAVCCSRGQIELPHPPHDFRIENTCGTCMLEEPIHRAWLRPFIVDSRHTPLITSVAGTFAPCVKRDMQVNYHGVRSVASMLQTWALLSKQPIAQTHVYMLVLSANLGKPVMLVDEGTLPPGLCGDGLQLAKEGRGICFLAERMAPCYRKFSQQLDVCLALELHGFAWAELFPEAQEPLLRAQTTIQISRRGGVMLRLVFPRNTVWTVETEATVVRDCNRLLACMRVLLAGRNYF
jgi:hypothetical protein